MKACACITCYMAYIHSMSKHKHEWVWSHEGTPTCDQIAVIFYGKSPTGGSLSPDTHLHCFLNIQYLRVTVPFMGTWSVKLLFTL